MMLASIGTQRPDTTPRGLAMAKDNNAVWSEINPDTLPEALMTAYADYKEQYRVMKAAR